MQLFPLIALALLLLISLSMVVIYFFVFLFPLIGGAPYVPSNNKDVDEMIGLAQPIKGKTAADLGSGDGRMVIALAKSGAIAHGYEISPILTWWSRWNTVKAGVKNTTKIFNKNFWNIDLSHYDIIFLYQLPYVMKKLEGKLDKELKPGTKIVCNGFSLPNWKPETKTDRVFLYIKS